MTTVQENFLVDLKFTDDFKANSRGDYVKVSGTTNLKEALFRRIITSPGTLLHRPTYGCGLKDFQGAPVTLDVKRAIANRLKTQVPQDPRVVRIVSLSVSSEDQTPEKLTIILTVDAVGQGEVTMTFTPFNEVP